MYLKKKFKVRLSDAELKKITKEKYKGDANYQLNLRSRGFR